MKNSRTFQSLIVLLGGLVSITISATDLRGQSTSHRVRVDRRTIKHDTPAPELYSDKLNLKITLMNLPGAQEASSYWQGEYRVYFVAEKDFETTMKQLTREGRNKELKPEYFPSRILLAKGDFSRRKLTTLRERTILREGIEFKGKIPPGQQTAFSNILTFYSIKVYDAKLRRSIYGSDVFVVPPFDTNTPDRTTFSPGTALYLNFFVSDNGSLYRSNRKSASETTEWRP